MAETIVKKVSYQSDWNETDSAANGYIKNKPNINSKLDKNLGSVNYGKFLSIDSEGNVQADSLPVNTNTIKDNAISTNTTWSSNKINTEISNRINTTDGTYIEEINILSGEPDFTGYYTENNIHVNDNDWRTFSKIKVNPNQTYYAFYTNAESGSAVSGGRINFYREDNSHISGIILIFQDENLNSNFLRPGFCSFKTPSETQYISYSYHASLFKQYIIPASDFPLKYQPPEKKFLNRNVELTISNFMPVFKLGKNLFNKYNIINGYSFYYADGKSLLYGLPTEQGVQSFEHQCFCPDYIPCTPNTDYVVNKMCAVAEYDINGNFLFGHPLVSGGTFKTDFNTYYLRVGQVYQADKDSFMLCEGSTLDNIEYEPFKLIPRSDITSNNFKILTISQDGTKDYETISSAVGDASDNDIILIYPGEYDEEVHVYDKNIHLIGLSKEKCILTHSGMNYTKPPLEIAKGSVKNLTIKATNTGTQEDDHKAYCVHIDNDNEISQSLTFENVSFINEVHQGVGIGLRSDFTLTFDSCDFNTTEKAALYCHDWEDQGNQLRQNQKLIIKNCTFINDSTTEATIKLQSQQLDTIEPNTTVTFINNRIINKNDSDKLIEMAFWYNSNGSARETNLKNGFMQSADWVLSDESTGNNLKLLNILKNEELDNLKEQALGAYATAMKSGIIVSFSDGVDNIPIKELTVNITSTIGITEANIIQCGKNLYSGENINATQFIEIAINPIPAGDYTISAVTTSNDTDTSRCIIYFLNNNDNVSFVEMPRSIDNNRVSGTFTLPESCNKMYFYASTGWDQSEGDEFSFQNIQIERGSNVTDYEQYNGILYSIGLPLEVTSGTLKAITGKLISGGIEYNVAPVEIKTLLGNNIIYSNCGDVSVEYRTIINGVSSVSGKTGDVTLCAGDVAFNEQDSYESGTVGVELTELKSAIETKISTQQMQECDTIEVPKSLNLWNPEIAENGYLHKNGTNYTGGNYDNYCHASIGEVEQGDVLYFYYDNGSYIARSNPIFIVCYDSNGTVMPDAGMNNVNTFTVPEGVAEIKITVTDSYSPVYMAIKNDDTTPSGFIPYSEAYSYYIAKKGFIHTAFVEESADIMSAGDMDEGKFLKAKTVEDGKVTEWEFDEAGATGDFVEKGGTDQVAPKNLQIMEKTYSPNLIDETKITNGIYIQKNGVPGSGNYQVTDYIPVEAGGKYYFTWLLNNTSRTDGTVRFLACYNSSKEIMPLAGSDSTINSFPMTIAEGISYVRLTFSNNAKYTKYQFEKGETPTPYYAYGTILSAIINDQYLPDDTIEMSEIPAFQLVDGQNLLNQEDPDFMVGFLYTGGTVDATMTSYRTSGYIAVTQGDHLMGSYVSGGGDGYITFRTVAAYNSNKTVINASGAYSLDSNVGYHVPSGVSFVRICYAYGSYGDNVQICKTDSNRIKPYVPYAEPHYELKGNYLAPFPSAPEHVYLPDEIYVAVGRSIEFYNEQIVLDYEKYHFQWKCAKGHADKRKFSITGTSTGNVNLTLTLYDNKMNICWVGACTIHVVAASNPTVKIIPIGDSLTRGKAWLPEVMLLSSSNVEWLGTRYSNNLKDSENNTYAQIHHEGRSGWSAGDYLADTSYTEDSNYDGIGTISGSANPFWDGAKFSLNHYLTTQTGVSTPDAVQIFLGTNDLTVGVDSAIENIVAIVDSIRSEYADLPIFVCNTIYRSNQNGYGSVGNDAYAGAGAGANSFQYEQDSRVMDLLVGLRNALRSMTGVYLVPLASCMDREYDFGQTMTKVNPRSAVEIAMPTESVHPQAPGYYQMADVMYSYYCGVFAE